MAKKMNHIKVLTNADKNVLKGLYRVGRFTSNHINALGVNNSRLKQHIKQGYIEKAEQYYDRKTKTTQVIYKLTDKGKKICQEQCNVGKVYKAASPKHDLALADRYVELHRQGLTDRWITEQDWRNKLADEIDRLRQIGNHSEADRIQEDWNEKRISMPDGGYVNANGELVALEVITRNYSESDIEHKKCFVQTLGVGYDEINIR